MGKKKTDLESLRRDDVTENNWEVPEKERTEEQVCDAVQIQEPIQQVPEKEELTVSKGDIAKPRKDDDFGGMSYQRMKGIVKLEAYSGGESLLGLAVAILGIIRAKVDPEITAGNPVEHWAVADDHCTFVFRDGRKVRVSL